MRMLSKTILKDGRNVLFQRDNDWNFYVTLVAKKGTGHKETTYALPSSTFKEARAVYLRFVTNAKSARGARPLELLIERRGLKDVTTSL